MAPVIEEVVCNHSNETRSHSFLLFLWCNLIYSKVDSLNGHSYTRAALTAIQLAPPT